MIIDHIRDFNEFKKLYESRPMDDGGQYPLEHVINNPNLFCFYNEDERKDKKQGELLGFVFVTQNKQKQLYLSGVSISKNMPNINTAIIIICNAFNQDMYSNTDKREAILVLLKAGFKKVKENLYRRVYNG